MFAERLNTTLLKLGLAEWLENAIGDTLLEDEDRAHEMIDDLLARRKLQKGKGGPRKAGASGAATGPSHIARDPAVVPKATELRHASFVCSNTRSIIEPVHERRNEATTVGALYQEAANDCKKAVKAIVDECYAKDKRFFDESFYYDKRDNLYPDGTPPDCTVAEPKGTARLSDLFPGAPLLSNGVSFDDVKQGDVGDCFFIGAVSALSAADPASIQRLIAAYDVDAGVYGVVFFKCGGWEWVIVDDFVATRKERSGAVSLMYANCGASPELWPMILEKAYAKVHYCWDCIDGGWGRDALQDLTGGFGSGLDLHKTDSNLSFKKFKELVDDHLTILACSVGDHVGLSEATGNAGEAGAAFGLYHNHQYSIISAAETADGAQFVRIRNPWGAGGEWTGRYADNAADWTKNPQHKAALNPEFKDDGAFWMLWEDFRQYMTSIDVVRNFPQDWKVLAMFGKAYETECPQNAYVLQICDTPTNVAIAFGQDDPKVRFGGKDHAAQRGPSAILKLSISQLRETPATFEDFARSQYRKVATVRDRQQCVFFSGVLDVGVYYIYPTMKSDGGSYLKLLAPPDADYALWRYSDGEGKRMCVGHCPPLTGSGAVPIAAPAAARKPSTTGTVAAAPAAAIPAPAAVAGGAAGAGPVVDLRKELEDATAYVKQLEKLIQQRDERIAALQASARTSYGRLGMDKARWVSVVQQVFFEVSAGQKAIDGETAISALRLIVTLAAGLDEVFMAEHVRLFAGKALSLEEFVSLCCSVADKWAVLS